MGIVITGGSLRGRRLPGRVGPGVRPTSARVREALFSMVGQNLSGCSVLDAYAGTGLLGFEAYSRGADSLTVVERDARTLGALKARAHELGVEIEILMGACPSALPATRRWDLVLADPPYKMEVREVLVGLAPHVGKSLALEYQSDWEPEGEAGGLVLERHRTYGNSGLAIYRREDS